MGTWIPFYGRSRCLTLSFSKDHWLRTLWKLVFFSSLLLLTFFTQRIFKIWRTTVLLQNSSCEAERSFSLLPSPSIIAKQGLLGAAAPRSSEELPSLCLGFALHLYSFSAHLTPSPARTIDLGYLAHASEVLLVNNKHAGGKSYLGLAGRKLHVHFV